MRTVYPVIITPDTDCYVVYVPGMEINTEGKDLADAIYMARDAIGACGLSYADDLKKSIPEPARDLPTLEDGQILAYVDIDFDEYRRSVDTHAVKKNCTIPSWLNDAAVEQHINFSQVLQEALKARLGLQ